LKVTFLGTGTSQGVPVIACDCEVCTSIDPKDKRLRSSILVQSESKTLVIDTGPDFRHQMLRANVQQLNAVVYTHQHKDHVAGLDDVRAFNYKQHEAIDVFATIQVQEALKTEFHYIFSKDDYPGIPKINLKNIASDSFFIGDIRLLPIEVMHYKLPVLGFRINDFTYITDAKTISELEMEKIRGSKIVVVNALQKESHISHFTLAEAISFAQDIGAETTYFTHISHKLGKHVDVSAFLPPNIKLAFDGLEIHI
jgi:phosphoribosyl 1,2-cyclic phosphate phosphodiesterase